MYLLFAFTTSIAASILLMEPVLNKLSTEQPKNTLVEYKFITYMTFIVLATIAAPFLILPTIFPNLNSTFQDSLLESIKD